MKGGSYETGSLSAGDSDRYRCAGGDFIGIVTEVGDFGFQLLEGG